MKYAYYPGCSLNSTGKEYNITAKAVAKKLGIELWEIPEWNCCGASAAHSTNHLLGLALPARNVALAEKEGLDVAVPCAACFSRMRAAQKAVRTSPKLKAEIQSAIEMDYEAKNEVKSLLDVFVNGVGLEKIASEVKKPLKDIKVAAYYGCLLVRPPEIAEFDDPENPMVMDNLLAALGAEPVDWGYKIECCSAGHATVKPEVGLKMINDIFINAVENGAEAIVTACPLCFLNLDMRQQAVVKKYGKDYNMPIFYFTELMGIALGFEVNGTVLKKHFVNPLPYLQSKGL